MRPMHINPPKNGDSMTANLTLKDMEPIGANPPKDEELMDVDLPVTRLIFHNPSTPGLFSMRSREWLSEQFPTSSPTSEQPLHPTLAGRGKTLWTSHKLILKISQQ